MPRRPQPSEVTLAYFDCTSGISGDMVLGALVDAGLAPEDLQHEVDRLHVGAQLTCTRVDRCGVRATRVEVSLDGQPMAPAAEHHLQPPGAEPRHHHTHLRDILAVVDGSDLSAADKEGVRQVFQRLAAAEAEVHGADVDAVGLHEVGSLDAIVDIAGAVAGLRRLGVTEVRASPLHCGTGTVDCAHGRYPLPTPGVVALCRNVPMVQTDIAAELVTPTGAALITTLARSFGPAPAFRLTATGYGAGGRDLATTPNVVRLRLGEAAAEIGTQRCVLIEANVDDMNPEIFGYLFERLLEAGARDVYVTPVLMKKGRPGHLLSVLVDPDMVDTVVAIVLGETTSLGLRFHDVERRVLERSSGSVETEYGPIQIKIAHLSGRRRAAPEYEDCARVARRRGVPILTVYGAALAAAQGEST